MRPCFFSTLLLAPRQNCFTCFFIQRMVSLWISKIELKSFLIKEISLKISSFQRHPGSLDPIVHCYFYWNWRTIEILIGAVNRIRSLWFLLLFKLPCYTLSVGFKKKNLSVGFKSYWKKQPFIITVFLMNHVFWTMKQWPSG